MDDIKINMMAIGVAVVAHFVLGFLWYTPLFGKAWAREMGMDFNEKPKPSEMAKGMIAMLVGNFLMAWVFAHNMAAWSFVPGANEGSPAVVAITAGMFTWLGFFLPNDIGIVTWERKSWKLFFINTGYHLVALILVAMILAFMTN